MSVFHCRSICDNSKIYKYNVILLEDRLRIKVFIEETFMVKFLKNDRTDNDDQTFKSLIYLLCFLSTVKRIDLISLEKILRIND